MNFSNRFSYRQLRVGLGVSFFLVLSAASLRSQVAPLYTGQVELPISLYTAEKVELEKGKYDLEIRTSQSGYVLAFLSDGKVLASVNAQSAVSGNSEVPLVGTIYLYPGKSSDAASEKHNGGAHGVDNKDFVLAEFLQIRPWNASMRVYKCRNPVDAAVYFIFQRKAGSSAYSTTEFKLFRTKPS